MVKKAQYVLFCFLLVVLSASTVIWYVAVPINETENTHCLTPYNKVERATDDRKVPGTNPTCVASKLGQVRLGVVHNYRHL